jgi:SagB-type dehydrogenase family enzyme
MSAVWFESISGDGPPEACFELYHENSKHIRRARARAPEPVGAPPPRSTAFDSSPTFTLQPASLSVALNPPPAATMRPGKVAQGTLAALMAPLALSHTEGRDMLEVYVHAAAIAELPGGLFRYDRSRNAVQLMRRGDLSASIAGTLPDPQPVRASALQIFVVGMFRQAAWTAGERGYRSALIAAGGLVRDIRLVAATLSLASVGTDAFYDREIDTIVGLDGLTAGTLYMVLVGEAGE